MFLSFCVTLKLKSAKQRSFLYIEKWKLMGKISTLLSLKGRRPRLRITGFIILFVFAEIVYLTIRYLFFGQYGLGQVLIQQKFRAIILEYISIVESFWKKWKRKITEKFVGPEELQKVLFLWFLISFFRMKCWYITSIWMKVIIHSNKWEFFFVEMVNLLFDIIIFF